MMFVKAISILLLFLAAIILTSCASRPVLYPNSHYKTVGEAQAEKDIDEAIAAADNAKGLGHPNDKNAANTAVSTGMRAGTGAASGAISGGAGVGAATGAINGAGSGILHWIFSSEEPSATYKNYVNIYLQEKGYRVIGWK